VRSNTRGAAAQRNEATAGLTQPLVCFFDDDILFEPECVSRLWQALEQDVKLGGVNAMIVNQRYFPPGFVSRCVFTILNGRSEKTFAGKLLGPAVNLLPEDSDNLPEIGPVEWLNLGCTIYRRDALPSPPFDSFFRGYSLMEDVVLSVRVAEGGWKLANVRTARIFHDSQPGEHKSDIAAHAEMELINRHYVMTKVLKRATVWDYLRLAVWELFSLVSSTRTKNDLAKLPGIFAGKCSGLARILLGKPKC
jgi:GT2 family glycosyltransferase